MLDKINYIETSEEKFPMAFTLNVMETIQEKYGSLEGWSRLIQREGETDIKALKFFLTEAINEGIDIENETASKKREPITPKKVGRILTEIGLSGTANKIMNTIIESIQTDNTQKNAQSPQKT